MDLYSSFKGIEGMREKEKDRTGERERERPVKREEIVLVAMRERCYVSEQIGSKYSTF
jgi:hypothetical protein